MQKTESQDLESLSNGRWITLSKNNYFWKVMIDAVDATKGADQQYRLSICYGKNLSLASKKEPSHVHDFESREQAMQNLSKVFKEKLKNGYELFFDVSAVDEKENKKSGKKSATKIQKLTDPEESHKTLLQSVNVPAIFIEDFEEKMKKKASENTQQDANLGKRERTEEKQPKSNKKTTTAQNSGKKTPMQPVPMSLTEVLDNPAASGYSAHKMLKSENKSASKMIEQPSLPSQALPATSSSQKFLQNPHSQPTSAAKKAPQVSPSDPPFLSLAEVSEISKAAGVEDDREEANRLFKKRIQGTILYQVEHNPKLFTQQMIIQAKEEHLYVEYSVDEDLTINKHLLFRFENRSIAIKAADVAAEKCYKAGFFEDETPSAMIGMGSINVLKTKHRELYSNYSSHVEEVPVASNGHHGRDEFSAAKQGCMIIEDLTLQEDEDQMEGGCMEVEEIQEDLPIGDNLLVDHFSHSAFVGDKELPSLQDVFEIDSAKRQEEVCKFRETKELTTNSKMQPLGPNSEGMIALMLLQTVKPTIDVTSK